MSELKKRRLKSIMQAVLYGIVDLGYVSEDDVPEATRIMLSRGMKVIQLRAKNVEKSKVLRLARKMLIEIQGSDSIFIVNDYPDIALEVEADGVHVGQDDGFFEEIRNSVGDEMIIGRSTHSLAQAQQAKNDGFDYIGFGPLYATATKPGRLAIGLEQVSEHTSLLGSDFPVFCIGGVNCSRLETVKKAGAVRYVIVSELLDNLHEEEYWSRLGVISN